MCREKGSLVLSPVACVLLLSLSLPLRCPRYDGFSAELVKGLAAHALDEAPYAKGNLVGWSGGAAEDDEAGQDAGRRKRAAVRKQRRRLERL
jgi:hypothetical protein